MIYQEWIEEEKDPDYTEFHKKQAVDRTKLIEEDRKNKTIDKIKIILEKQFQNEIGEKAHEISVISSRINDTKVMLDRLRAYVVASYYGSGESIIPMSKALPQKKRKPANDKLGQVEENMLLIKKTFEEKFPHTKLPTSSTSSSSKNLTNGDCQVKSVTEATVVNRFYVTQKIIVGNVSKYLGGDTCKENDKSTHKWMVYVRGPAEDPDISKYIKSVWFFLHPSYIPNDIIQMNNPPFQLTRRGWGEFPVRVQLHFKDSRSKRFDIIHHLKLDKTYTGLQTLGAETIVNLELHRHTKDGHLVINSTNSDSGDQDDPLTKPLTELLCDTFTPIQDQPKCSGSLALVSPFESSSSSFKNDSANTSLLNGHTDCDIKMEYDGSSPSSIIRKEQLKTLSLGSSQQSLVSSCVTSASTSRCCSPVTPKLPQHFTFDNETDSILRRLVTNARLICPNKKIRFRSFTCLSLEQYKEWSFSKRRASEWQRSAFMKKLFCKHITETNKKLTIPSTKQIMIWCRKNGYTPSEKKLKVITETNQYLFCSLCGVIFDANNSTPIVDSWCKHCISNMHITFDSFNIMSSCHTMLDNIQLKEATLKSLNNLGAANDDNEYVDVVSTVKRNDDSRLVEVEIISSNELDWVYETTNNIDIHLPTLTISGVKGPFLQAMLLTATKCFVSELLRKGYSNAGERNGTTLEPSMITFYHLFKSIKSTAKFDFLTDESMGKVTEETIEGASKS